MLGRLPWLLLVIARRLPLVIAHRTGITDHNSLVATFAKLSKTGVFVGKKDMTGQVLQTPGSTEDVFLEQIPHTKISFLRVDPVVLEPKRIVVVSVAFGVCLRCVCSRDHGRFRRLHLCPCMVTH